MGPVNMGRFRKSIRNNERTEVLTDPIWAGPICQPLTQALYNALEALYDALEALYDALDTLCAPEAPYYALEPLHNALETLSDALEIPTYSWRLKSRISADFSQKSLRKIDPSRAKNDLILIKSAPEIQIVRSAIKKSRFWQSLSLQLQNYVQKMPQELSQNPSTSVDLTRNPS